MRDIINRRAPAVREPSRGTVITGQSQATAKPMVFVNPETTTQTPERISDTNPAIVAPNLKNPAIFHQEEILSVKTLFGMVGRNGSVLRLRVARGTRHKLYGFVFGNSIAAGEYYLRGELQLLRTDAVIARYPWGFGVSVNGSVGRQSIACPVASSVNTMVKDAILLTVANLGMGEPASVYLAPMCIDGHFDQVNFAILEQLNINDARVWLGILSDE